MAKGSTRQLKNGNWECIIQSSMINPESKDLKPKRIKRTAETKSKAEKLAYTALLAWEKAVKENNIDEVKKANTKTFGEFMENFVEDVVKENISGSTYKSYIYALKQNFYNYKISKLQLKMLNKVEFEIFFDTIIHDKSYKTATFPMQLCKRCCQWLVDKSLLEENYAEQAKVKKEKKDEYFRSKEKENESKKEIFTNEDILKFYDSYKNGVSEYSAAVILILETMMRGQELLTLRIDDIDFDKNSITIKSAISERFIDNDKTKGLEKYEKVPKNGKQRTIYMTPLAKEVIEYMMAQTRMKCRDNSLNLLFPSFNRNGKMRTMDAFEMQFKTLCDKLGIDRDVRPTKHGRKKGLSVHALRHTAITIANTSPNANVINTALMAGHTAIRTENIYTHTNVEALKSIRTAGSFLIDKDEKEHTICDNKNDTSDTKTEELYQMYLKLKDMFEK